jgi:hypothetical protein
MRVRCWALRGAPEAQVDRIAAGSRRPKGLCAASAWDSTGHRGHSEDTKHDCFEDLCGAGDDRRLRYRRHRSTAYLSGRPPAMSPIALQCLIHGQTQCSVPVIPYCEYALHSQSGWVASPMAQICIRAEQAEQLRRAAAQPSAPLPDGLELAPEQPETAANRGPAKEYRPAEQKERWAVDNAAATDRWIAAHADEYGRWAASVCKGASAVACAAEFNRRVLGLPWENPADSLAGWSYPIVCTA